MDYNERKSLPVFIGKLLQLIVSRQNNMHVEFSAADK
jgi:hypothetical protein